ncbi:hypothetical protein [Streptomyces sp. HUAS TT20]|uniref:hypothetical protein n=1 Tax=Streptomyces sp. HUAS TT20 TaxID=3447509 RepID=UPI0021D8B5DC|nr:hypothetical protein [Streptomyces sp. HUAS 15-9]UXY30005.1 hypothetical protein N8I87_27945 [Streptomyces sp. HUAS 15-9]
MRTEEDTPPVERILLVESRADDGALAALGHQLPERSGNEEALFLSYNYADVPLGRRYDCCFRRADESDVARVAVTVVAVTQQFGRMFDEIPHGWKTLTVLRFEPEIPALIRDLPAASAWFEQRVSLYISDQETWQVRTAS